MNNINIIDDRNKYTTLKKLKGNDIFMQIIGKDEEIPELFIKMPPKSACLNQSAKNINNVFIYNVNHGYLSSLSENTIVKKVDCTITINSENNDKTI